MKEKIILICLIAFSVIAAFCFLTKLLLWLRLNPASRIGFIRSFFAFYSIHDVHNASSRTSKVFRKHNNNLNAFFWASLFGLAIVFVFNTSNSGGLIPTKRENREYKDKSPKRGD